MPAESMPLTPRTSTDSTRDFARPPQSLSPLPPSPTLSPSSPDRAPNAYNGRPASDLDSDEGAVSEDVDNVGEGSPMLHKWGGAGAVQSPDGDEREELMRLSDDDDDEFGPSGTPITALAGQWESTANDTPNLWTEARLTRGQKRRVYGGGRHGEALEGGGMSAGEVAGLVLAGTCVLFQLVLYSTRTGTDLDRTAMQFGADATTSPARGRAARPPAVPSAAVPHSSTQLVRLPRSWSRESLRRCSVRRSTCASPRPAALTVLFVADPGHRSRPPCSRTGSRRTASASSWRPYSYGSRPLRAGLSPSSPRARSSSTCSCRRAAGAGGSASWALA